MAHERPRCLRSTAGRLLTGIIALAIALSDGLEDRRGSPAAQRPAVCSMFASVAVDVLKAGTRLEPKILPASFERTPAVSTFLDYDLRRLPTLASGCRARVHESRAQGERSSIVKRVPRMERGDPPKA
jgi:hypothetical protein